jgi:hypothetical protein
MGLAMFGLFSVAEGCQRYIVPPVAFSWLKLFEQSISFDFEALMVGNDETFMVVLKTDESLQTLSFIFTV